MKRLEVTGTRRQVLAAILLLMVIVQIGVVAVAAQNLGAAPQLNKSVQGQSASQPEGAFLNVVNWIGNVICPVGAALCVVMAVVSYTHGRGVMRWAVAAVGLLCISGLTRLLEFFVTQGTGGI